jgi:hypothetical protein
MANPVVKDMERLATGGCLLGAVQFIFYNIDRFIGLDNIVGVTLTIIFFACTAYGIGVVLIPKEDPKEELAERIRQARIEQLHAEIGRLRMHLRDCGKDHLM